LSLWSAPGFLAIPPAAAIQPLFAPRFLYACFIAGYETIPTMNGPASLKLRMATDFLLVCVFGFAVPPMLAPLSRSWTLLFTSFVALLLACAFLWDGLRMLGRLRKPRSS
jgi:hypothetical protein